MTHADDETDQNQNTAKSKFSPVPAKIGFLLDTARQPNNVSLDSAAARRKFLTEFLILRPDFGFFF